MNKQDTPFLSASELSGLIRASEVSPVEATEACLARTKAVDGQGRLQSCSTLRKRDTYLPVYNLDSRPRFREDDVLPRK